MADVVGFLRDDATIGERGVLKLLRDNLPKEYSVYVETPIHRERDFRYPDFVVLTNYGVIVLEVKDWVSVEGRATPHGVTVRTRDGKTRKEKNPVQTARDFAILLSKELNDRRYPGQSGEAIPWSYAAVLFNLPTSVITQLRTPWGQEFVLGKSDLENPDLLLDRLKNTFPVLRMRSLNREELDQVRATIYPVVEIEIPGRASFVLDQQQERIVAEPIKSSAEVIPKSALKPLDESKQEQLFSSIAEEEKKEELPILGEKISKDIAIRLVRGFSGSGKTLVLIQRAKFLAAQYPEWKIGVLIFNKPLQRQLETYFIGTKIQVKTFHGLCKQITKVNGNTPMDFGKWLKNNLSHYPITSELRKTFIEKEIDYIRDLGLEEKEDYIKMERKGMGRDQRLSKEQREQLFELLGEYRKFLETQDLWDFPELPRLLLGKPENFYESNALFDAVLIDEAQDWAPVWFRVMNRLLNKEHGLMFLADDPSQSIYRRYSWREKHVEVVGRTRWLKVPYRNTYEIYKAAYSLISDNDEIQNSLKEEGEIIRPEVTSQGMRHGKKPLIYKLSNTREEMFKVKNLIDLLKSDGIREDQIAVLLRHRRDVTSFTTLLQGSGVTINPIHSFKGLEMEAVIIPHIHTTFQNQEEESSERRLIYMAMSRARERLYLTYSGRLPCPYNVLRSENLADFIN